MTQAEGKAIIPPLFISLGTLPEFINHFCENNDYFMPDNSYSHAYSDKKSMRYLHSFIPAFYLKKNKFFNKMKFYHFSNPKCHFWKQENPWRPLYL